MERLIHPRRARPVTRWMACLVAGLVTSLMALLPAHHVVAQISTLHGNAAEAQAVSEMRGRLRAALANGNVAVCQREGENLARYQRAALGKGLIDADLLAVQQRLKQISKVYDYFREIHDLNDKKAVQQAYALIRDVQDKLVNDAAVNVAAVLITAPMPLLGQMVVEMGTAAEDFMGSYADARGLVNRANALRGLEKMARYADEQMKSLIPAAREAEALRTRLIDCATQYQEGVASVPGGGAVTEPGRTYVAEKGGPDTWSHVRVTLANVISLKAQDSPGWRNNGTGFTATASTGDPVSVRVDLVGKGGVSYFDYVTSIVVKTSDGKTLIAEKPVISKDGGNASYSANWTPKASSSRVSVEAKITGGNPEYFTYFVTGSVRVGPKLANSDPARSPANSASSHSTGSQPGGAPSAPIPPPGKANLAAGKPVQQSSTSYGGDARRVTDGNTDGRHANNSVSHTAEQAQPWLFVDLGAVQEIETVRIWNRTDCCSERLSNFYVFVSDNPFTSTNLATTINQSGVWKSYQRGPAATTTTLSVKRSGRYVGIQLEGTNYLSIAEVEVFGTD